MKQEFRLISLVIAVFASGMAAHFAYRAWAIQQEYAQGDAAYAQIASFAVKETEKDSHPKSGAESSSDPSIVQNTVQYIAANSNPNDEHTESPEPTGDSVFDSQSSEDESTCIPSDLPDVDFAALKAVNAQVIGWLYSPDTVINYPVVKGTDNAYYLNHLVTGKRNSNGCLFMDAKNVLTDNNLIIYGHNMRSGKMFASLNKYRSADYYAAHPFLYWITEAEVYRVDIFSMHTVSASGNAFQRAFAGVQQYAEWLRELQADSDVHTDTVLSTEDRVLTLVTCTNTSSSKRYTVHGKLTLLHEWR